MDWSFLWNNDTGGAGSTDSDSDGIADGVEYSVHGSNPTASDTDGDGLDDACEVANGLNMLVNDANDDLDLDGVSNLIEYNNRTNGYCANRADSLNDGKSDFERLFGKKPVKHYYDKNDRLVELLNSITAARDCRSRMFTMATAIFSARPILIATPTPTDCRTSMSFLQRTDKQR